MKKSYLVVSLAEVYWTPDDFADAGKTEEEARKEFEEFEPDPNLLYESAKDLELQSYPDAVFCTQVGDNCCGHTKKNVILRCENCDCEIDPQVIFDKRE